MEEVNMILSFLVWVIEWEEKVGLVREDIEVSFYIE